MKREKGVDFRTLSLLQHPSNDVSFQAFLLSHDGESYVVVEVYGAIGSYADAVAVLLSRIYFAGDWVYFY
jgi:hypothetical protein